MRAARISMFGPDLMPVTMVLVDAELEDPWDDAIARQRILAGGYVVVDEFETEHELMGATMEAIKRGQEAAERERNAALLYHYDANLLSQISEAGVLTMTIPSPLTVEQIIDVFEQLAHHPLYRHQLCVGISEDERIVTMRDGDAHEVRDGGRNGDSA